MGGRYYTGYDLETGNYTEGHVALLHSWGDSGYIKNGNWASTTKQWTAADVPVPADATVKAARLYQSYTWSSNGDPGITAQFNGNTVEQTAFYGDGLANIYSTYDDFNGQVIWDVTPYFSKDGNTAIINAAAPQGGLYATVLVVVYEDSSEPYRKVWLDEGCDSLLYGGTGYAMFNNVTTGQVSTAKISTMVPSGADNSQDTVIFNSQSIARTGAEGTNEGQDPGFKYYDVTNALQDGTNELGVTSDGSYLNLAVSILELTYETPPAEVTFKANVTSGETPLAVQFTDLSYGATSWQWDFDNDGTIDNTEKNPVYTFTAAGTYTVNLTVTNAYGSATETKTDYITVTTPTGGAPIAAFSTSATNDVAPVTASFTDASTNTPTSWLWEYRLADNGAWATFSTEKNPSFDFTTAGTYDIRLTATNAIGSDTVTKYHVLAAATEHDYLATIASGTVSGDLYVDSVSPWGDMGGSTYTQSYTLPASGSNIAWAQVFVNVYSGSGTNNYPVLLTTEFDADGDGTFETVLGTETCDIQSGTNGYAYPLNDHVTKVYSDYEAWYDVTSLITSANPKVRVTAANVPGQSLYDGRIKGITLVVAYNDSDADQVRYWVNHGNDWTTESSSTGFDTSALASGWTTAELRDVAFSSDDASYTFNSGSITKTALGTGTYYKYNSFDVTGSLLAGAANTFGFTNTGASFKTCLATLAVKYPATTPSAPVADFSADPTSGTAPLTVTFTDASTNTPASWSWTFGDGATSDQQNPVHEYTATGTYTVTLTATNSAGSDDETKTDSITVTEALPPAPGADFSADPTSGMVPLTVTFTDASTNTPTEWAWLFGDGATSDQQHPSHDYTVAGTYTVTLTATNAGGSGSETKTGYITVEALPAAPVAAFTATPTTGNFPLDVQFTDESTNAPTSWAWAFGDGGTSDQQNPVHQYTAAGTYTVTLTATNAGGSDDEVRAGYIQVTDPDAVMLVITPQTGAATVGSSQTYTFTANSLPHGLSGMNVVVSLSDPSVGEITGISVPAWAALSSTSAYPGDQVWFGGIDGNELVQDGATDVSLGSVTVRADAIGTTSVLVTVPEFDDDYGDVIPVTVGTAALAVYQPVVADFIADATAGTVPFTVQFTDISTGDPAPTGWSWDFDGDGVVDSTDQHPSFEYVDPGTYTVTLTASNPYSQDAMTRTNYIVVTRHVEPFPGQTRLPTDPDGDGFYEDVNGNGRMDFDDVVVFYRNIEWVRNYSPVGAGPYDFNGNGRIDLNDVVLLFKEVIHG
ncbi:MAG: DUF3344 domain-containing protein [Methanoregulaceae archaeon]|jgi:PKD repeat protein